MKHTVFPQWGHDFRPAYRQIMDGVKSIKSNPNILALTATATPSVQKDIADQLQIPSAIMLLLHLQGQI